MTAYICTTCGTEFPPSEGEPESCPICQDERQYVGLGGQKWISHEELAHNHHNDCISLEPGLFAVLTKPAFAIGQRALLVESPGGNVLWDCVALVDDYTVAAVRKHGELAAIAISHPHYYTTMNRWSEAFGNVPIYLHEADSSHIVNPGGQIHLWSGETYALHDGMTLVRCGGHYEGGTVLHWPGTEDGKGALLTGDIIQVVPDRRWVSFMRSYPNLIPLNANAVRRIVAAVKPYEFDRVYGAFHPMQVSSDGKNAVRRSADRYLGAI